MDAATIVPPSKTCTKCGEAFPATAEYFHRDKNTQSGLVSQCKTCKFAVIQQWREKHPDYNREYSAQYRADHAEAIRTSMRQWYKDNPDYQQQRRAADPEKFRERSRSYYARTADKRREQARRSYHRRPETRKPPPEKVRLYALHRRARKIAAEGTHTTADIETQYQRQKGRCYYCNCKLTNERQQSNSATVDHVIPLTRGGRNSPDNLVLACAVCNSSKHDKLPHEWYGNNGRLL